MEVYGSIWKYMEVYGSIWKYGISNSCLVVIGGATNISADFC